MKVYFHVGSGKTGSSAIQSFLNYNREALAERHHILYPNFNSFEPLNKGFYHNHTDFFTKLHESKSQQAYLNFKNCLEFSLQNGINKIVFSSEMFQNVWLADLIKEVSEAFKFDFKIILYLRRQDHFLEAAWKQWGHKMLDINTIQEYSKRVNLNWYSTIQIWLKQMNPEKFIIRPYEKPIIGESIVNDFMNLLGVESLNDFKTPPDNNLNNNNGFNIDVIEIMKLSRSLHSNINNNDLSDFLYNSLSHCYKKPIMASYNFLSPRERLKIIEQYAESNNKIASTFLGKGSVLFHDPLPDPDEPWEPYSGLTLEKAIPILMEILLKLSKDINQMRQSIQPKKVTFRFSGTDLFQNSTFNKQILNKKLINDEIHFESISDDPVIILPKFENPYNYLNLKLEISVPESTTIQLFYRTKLFGRYREEKSVRIKAFAGRNIVNFKISERNINKRIRLDPGCHAGKYTIHIIELCE